MTNLIALRASLTASNVDVLTTTQMNQLKGGNHKGKKSRKGSRKGTRKGSRKGTRRGNGGFNGCGCGNHYGW